MIGDREQIPDMAQLHERTIDALYRNHGIYVLGTIAIPGHGGGIGNALVRSSPLIQRSHRIVLAAAAMAFAIIGCTADPPSDRTVPPIDPTSAFAAEPSRAPRDPALGPRLVQAASADDAESVRELIAGGADLEFRGDHDRTPLIAATKNRASAAARALIEAGADVNAKDDMEDSAYLYAGAEGIDDILELTLRHGADIRSVNRYGGTALIPACEHGYLGAVRLLIEAGVDVDHVNEPGWTAMHEAILYGDGSERYQRVVTALLDAGADPSIRDASGRTALDNAQRRGQTTIVSILEARN
ncbi:ankyrin repeat domain-containing protein [Nocardia xishanensis]|uniref:Ankyrin repeat domain-containing protein n=1 Tax=Nocardia xishanensis TaxID=238964 RepID=A0ABW7X0H8_9NOCA